MDIRSYSIVIPTYNRSEYLENTIKSIWNLTILPLEIIIVDNLSTDQTKEVIRRLQFDSPIPLKYLLESRQGTNFARGLGSNYAKGDIVIFLDDDIVADENLAAAYIEEFERDNGIACVQGGIRLHFENPKPSWLLPELEGYLGSTRRFGRDAKNLDSPFFPISANMAVQRQILMELGGFKDQLWTRKGKGFLTNDEYEFAFNIRNCGLQIYYQPAAYVWHQIPNNRLQRKFFLHRAYWQGVSDALWLASIHNLTRIKFVKICLVHLRAIVNHSLRISTYLLTRKKISAFREFIYGMERVGRLSREIGWILIPPRSHNEVGVKN